MDPSSSSSTPPEARSPIPAPDAATPPPETAPESPEEPVSGREPKTQKQSPAEPATSAAPAAAEEPTGAAEEGTVAGAGDSEPDSIPAVGKDKEEEDAVAAPHWAGQEVFRDSLAFQLAGDCKLVLHIGDITKWGVDGETDAIVNAANERMLGGGGVDGAIHRAAGPELLEMCRAAPEVYKGVRCLTGSAVTTGAGRLPVKHVVHTVGPIYHAVDDPAVLLSSAYRSSMEQAKSKGVKHIAFPAISCGIYGYPAEEAAGVSIKAVQETCESMKEVHFVLFEKKEYRAWLRAAEGLNLSEAPLH